MSVALRTFVALVSSAAASATAATSLRTVYSSSQSALASRCPAAARRSFAIGNMSSGSPSPDGYLPGRDTPEPLSNVHVVLKTPLRPPYPEGMKTAVFATGCYWGAEKGFWKLPGVYSTAVGYAGGQTPNPTYRESCTGKTGHTEAVLVVYDPEKIDYCSLLQQFYTCHDPSQYMGQGGDIGDMYRSAIYTYDDDQMTLALAARDAYAKALDRQIHTEIRPMSEAGPFYFAHEEYQQYLARPGSRQYCSAQPQGVPMPPFEEWVPEELREKYAPKLPEEYWAKYGPKPGCTIKGHNEQNVWP